MPVTTSTSTLPRLPPTAGHCRSPSLAPSPASRSRFLAAVKMQNVKSFIRAMVIKLCFLANNKNKFAKFLAVRQLSVRPTNKKKKTPNKLF